MRRKEIAIYLALGGILLLAALLDLPSLFSSNAPPSATIQRASVPKRAVAADTAATSLAPKALGDRAAESASFTFDVIRMDPDGVSVFAGRAPADASVTVLANGEPVAATTADRNGEWSVVIDRQFAPGEYQLSLSAKVNGAATQLSGQSVRITIASSARPTLADAKVTAQPSKVATLPSKVAAQPSKIATLASKVAAPLPPAPITFPYDEANVTAAGRQQAAALSEFLRRHNLDTATLSGHADERGSEEYNMQLSRTRLENVARYLRESGYAGKLVLVPKGKSEPYTNPDRSKLSKEDAFQLDRRVELRLGQ